MLILKKFGFMSLMLVPAMMAVGCGSSTSVRFADYSVASIEKQGGGMLLATKAAESKPTPTLPPMLTRGLKGLYEILVPKARAAGETLKLCFKEIRVKRKGGNNSDGDKNQSIDVGLVTMDEAGTDLTEIELQSGEYKLIEFDLKDECDTGYSVQFGAEETNEHTQIRFSGTYDPDEDGDVVTLTIQSLVTALGGQVGADFKTVLEAESGTF